VTRGTSSLVIAADIFLFYKGKLRDFVKIASEFIGCMFFVQDFSEKNLAALCVVITELRLFQEMNLQNRAL
jgi:hypothetical protein